MWSGISLSLAGRAVQRITESRYSGVSGHYCGHLSKARGFLPSERWDILRVHIPYLIRERLSRELFVYS